MRQALQSVLIFFFTFVLTLFAITELEKVGVTWRRVPEAAPAQEARARTSPAKVRKMTKKKKVVAATKQRGPKVNETAENRARAAALAARTTFTSLDEERAAFGVHRLHESRRRGKNRTAATREVRLGRNATAVAPENATSRPTAAPTASTYSWGCESVAAQTEGGVEVCSRPGDAAPLPSKATFAAGSKQRPVHLFVLSDGSSASTPVLMLLARSRAGTG